ITDLDVLGIINAKKRTAPVQARNELGHIKRLFKWAVDQRVYGLKTSPCDSLKPGTIIGEKKSGNRILNDACQSASKFAPRSASNFDPFGRRVRTVALAPSELVRVAETARARVVG